MQHHFAALFPRRRAAVAASLALISTLASAADFACVSGGFNDCALATSHLSWTWNGLDYTIVNNGGGFVSEVYFDLGSGMTASFLGGTGTVDFYAGANPAKLPGGNAAGFQSDASSTLTPDPRTTGSTRVRPPHSASPAPRRTASPTATWPPDCTCAA